MEPMDTPYVSLRGFNSLDGVMRFFGFLNWKAHETPDGGKMAFTVLSGNRETGEVHVLAVIERGTAPEHEHTDGGPYGEMIVTIDGELEDITDGGTPITLRAGSVIFHRGATVHAPRAPDFWFGYYHQPKGSTLTSR